MAKTVFVILGGHLVPELLDFQLNPTSSASKLKERRSPTHKFYSPVFTAMFEHDISESSSHTVVVDDIEPEVFQQLNWKATKTCPYFSSLLPTSTR